MTLKFMDSFDHYATAQISQKWTAVTGATIGASAGRRSTGGAQFSGAAQSMTKSIAATATFYIGFALYITSSSTGGYLIYLGDSGSDQCGLFLGSDGTLSFRRGTTNLTTSSNALSTGAWNYIEFLVTINNTTGVYEVRVNGSATGWIANTTGANTRSTANNSANTILMNARPAAPSGGFAGSIVIDDFYYCDSAGSVNNSFLGDVRIDCYMPDGNGNSSQLVGSDSNSTDNYLLVDESAPNGDTDYVQSSTVNNKDTYTFADMSHTPTSIFATQLNMSAKKDDSGTRSICAVCRSGGTDYDGDTQALGTSYVDYRQIREVDPATSAAWTRTNLNSAEFGVKVAA